MKNWQLILIGIAAIIFIVLSVVSKSAVNEQKQIPSAEKPLSLVQIDGPKVAGQNSLVDVRYGSDDLKVYFPGGEWNLFPEKKNNYILSDGSGLFFANFFPRGNVENGSEVTVTVDASPEGGKISNSFLDFSDNKKIEITSPVTVLKKTSNSVIYEYQTDLECGELGSSEKCKIISYVLVRGSVTYTIQYSTGILSDQLRNKIYEVINKATLQTGSPVEPIVSSVAPQTVDRYTVIPPRNVSGQITTTLYAVDTQFDLQFPDQWVLDSIVPTTGGAWKVNSINYKPVADLYSKKGENLTIRTCDIENGGCDYSVSYRQKYMDLAKSCGSTFVSTFNERKVILVWDPRQCGSGVKTLAMWVYSQPNVNTRVQYEVIYTAPSETFDKQVSGWISRFENALIGPKLQQ
jgi:hypothetical protein